MSAEEERPPSKVYFLGAGASAEAAGLPVMSNFFDGFDPSAEKNQSLADVLNATFGRPCKKDVKKPYKDLNLEDVMTYLDITLTGFPRSWPENQSQRADLTKHYKAQDELVEYIVQRLDNIPALCDENQLVKALKPITEYDAVITTNYDLVLEAALLTVHCSGPGGQKATTVLFSNKWDLLQPSWWGYSVHVDESFHHRGCLLKLHGSLDFGICPNAACPNHSYFHRYGKTVGPMSGTAVTFLPGMPCPACGSSFRRVIVPPVVNKTFTDYPRLGAIWRRAFMELCRASELHILGFSLADTDYSIHWLLRSTLRRRGSEIAKIKIANESKRKSQDVAEKIEKLLGETFDPDRIKTYNGIEDYVKDLKD